MAGQRAREAAGEQEVAAEPSRLFLTASYVTLVAGGVLLALFGAFLLPYSVSPATHAVASVGGTVTSGRVLASGGGGGLGQLLSVGLLVVIIANPLLSMAGYWMAGTRLAAAAPLLGWLPVVLVLGSSQSTGSTVLSSDLRSSAFLLLGVISFGAVTALGRPTRGMGAATDRPARGVPAARPVPPRPPAAKRPAKSAARRTAPKGGRRR
ncbi:MAG TPA: hypothetical protein VHZ96_23935 [Frankiaceae bacterium]|nr:hypothetical protein [Frankiaceae bacterium]